MLAVIEKKNTNDSRPKLGVGVKSVFAILEGLLKTNRGKLPEAAKSQIIRSVESLHFKTVLSYPAYLHKHNITYEDFPEVW